jgi:prophage antirepressor-like protein
MSKNSFIKMAPVQFDHKLFGNVRILKTKEGEIWFVAMDVCKALGLTNMSRAVAGLDLDEKDNAYIPHSGNDSSELRKTRIVSESGLYSLILRSRKPEARKFKKWVTSDVLPSIRKYGAYVNKQLADPTWLRELADEIEQKELNNAQNAIAMI